MISMNNHVFLNQCLVTRMRVSRYNSETEAPITASKVPLYSPSLKLSHGMNNSVFKFCAIFQVFQNRVTNLRGLLKISKKMELCSKNCSLLMIDTFGLLISPDH